jgi:TonB family protein
LLLLVLGGLLFRKILAGGPAAEKQAPAVEAAPALPEAAPSKPAEPAKKAPATRGEVVRKVLPDVPQSAQDTITGTVRISVKVHVDSAGKVTDAALVHEGPSKYFARLVLEAAQHWEFPAPQADGQPTESDWLLHFRLRKTSIEATPEQLRH